MAEQTADSVVRGAVDFFEEASSFEEKWREEWIDDLKFRALDQWPEDAKRARNVAGEPRRPCLTIDQTDQYVRQVVNDARLSPPALKAQPVDDKADIRVANDLQGLFRHIERVSRGPKAYLTALEWGVTCGRGFFRVYSHEIDARLNHYEPRIGRIPNALLVYFDPYSVELDGSDATDAQLAMDYSVGAFARKWPKADVGGSWDGVKPGWHSKETIRVVEWHSVRKRSQLVVLTADGEMTPEEAKKRQLLDFREETRDKKVCTIRTCNAREVLDEYEFHAPYVGLVPVYGNERYTDDGRKLFGLIRAAKDPQRLTNYLASNLAEAANGQTKSPWLLTPAAIAQHEALWAKANQSSTPYLLYNDKDENQQPINPPTRQSVDLQLGGYVQMMQWSHGMLQSTLGMFQASIGAPSNETSGVAIANRKRNSDVGTYHYIDNLSDSIQHGGRIIMAMLPKVYDTARVARILGEDDETSQVMIDPAANKPFQEQPGRDGKKMHVLNPNIGEYDVHVTVGPSFATRREETAATLAELLKGNPALLQLIGDIFFRNQDFPGAAQIADRLKAVLPDQIKALEDEGEVPPEIRELIQRVTQAMEMREKALMEALETAKADFEAASKAKHDASIERAQVDIARARLDTKEAQLQAKLEEVQNAMEKLNAMQRAMDQDTARMVEDISRAAQAPETEEVTDARI